MFATTCKSEQLARYLVHSTVPAECNTVIQPSCADDINSCERKIVICVSSNCKKKKSFVRIISFVKIKKL
uniref:Sortilin-related receptor-like n=1 Tax=Phallusia mammillata TaxID=59560 RepID=A0A6F9DTZ3_9ASCI|nr:sortilin-related receptor-like [Phallusia mammillata]